MKHRWTDRCTPRLTARKLAAVKRLGRRRLGPWTLSSWTDWSSSNPSSPTASVKIESMSPSSRRREASKWASGASAAAHGSHFEHNTWAYSVMSSAPARARALLEPLELLERRRHPRGAGVGDGEHAEHEQQVLERQREARRLRREPHARAQPRALRLRVVGLLESPAALRASRRDGQLQQLRDDERGARRLARVLGGVLVVAAAQLVPVRLVGLYRSDFRRRLEDRRRHAVDALAGG